MYEQNQNINKGIQIIKIKQIDIPELKNIVMDKKIVTGVQQQI